MKVYSVYGSYIKNGSKWHTLETTTGGDLEDVLDNIEKRLENDNEYKKDSFVKAKEMIIDAEIMLNKLIGTQKSQGEIRKRLEFISK